MKAIKSFIHNVEFSFETRYTCITDIIFVFKTFQVQYMLDPFLIGTMTVMIFFVFDRLISRLKTCLPA